MRFLQLLGLGVAIPVAGAVVRAAVRMAGGTLEFRYNSDAGVVTLYVLGLLGMVIFARSVWAVSLRSALALYRASARRVLFGFLLGGSFVAAVLVLDYLVLHWAGAAAWQPGLQRWDWQLAGRTLLALGAVILIATAEECIFRGFAFNYLRGSGTGSATVSAIFGSALLFALAHHIFYDPKAMFTAPEGLLLIGVFLLGVLLAVVYVASGSLACAAGVHAGLLLVEIFARNKATRLVLVSQPDWWMGVNGDLRTAPAAWVQLVALTLIVLWARQWARPLTAIEPPSPADDAGVATWCGWPEPRHGS